VQDGSGLGRLYVYVAVCSAGGADALHARDTVNNSLISA
jgi:hypothetical protein